MATIYTVTKHLTTADLLSLHTTAIEMLAAPGANKLIFPLWHSYQFIPGSRPFGKNSNAPGNVNIRIFLYTDVANPTTTDSAAIGDKIEELNGVVMIPIGFIQWNNQDSLTSVANNAPLMVIIDPGLTSAPITTSSKQAGGTGYVVGDTGFIDGGGNHLAAYTIDTVSVGAVVTYHLTATGNRYDTANNPLTTSTGGAQPGVGTGFTVNVDSILQGNGEMYLTVGYVIVDLV